MCSDQTEKALRPLKLIFHIQRDTILSLPADGVAMKTLISERHVVANLSVHKPLTKLIDERASSGSWKAARKKRKLLKR